MNELKVAAARQTHLSAHYLSQTSLPVLLKPLQRLTLASKPMCVCELCKERRFAYSCAPVHTNAPSLLRGVAHCVSRQMGCSLLVTHDV